MQENNFEFKSRLVLTELLGIKAKNLSELSERIKTVPLSSIYQHTHRFLQQHHYLSPEPPNDFAYWVTNMLNNEIAGEQLASIDVMQFNNLSDLRLKFVQILSSYTNRAENGNCPEGEEFYFMSSRIFVLPINKKAANIQEFIEVLKTVSIHSIYYHMFEARMRLEKQDNDFSMWLRSIGMKKEADTISRFDPYTFTLEGLRQKILETINGNS